MKAQYGKHRNFKKAQYGRHRNFRKTQYGGHRKIRVRRRGISTRQEQGKEETSGVPFLRRKVTKSKALRGLQRWMSW